MLLQLEQGSPEWLDLRKNKIGASDAPIILGDSPYLTPYQLWEIKTGRKEQKWTHSMRFGVENEEVARKLYEDQTGIFVMPKVFIHEENEWMMASLDGLSFDGSVIVEIKCCNEYVFEQARRGVVDKRYYAQLQHQLSCVPSASFVHFFCMHKGGTALVTVERDHSFIEKMIEKEEEFYYYLTHDIAPPAEEKDTVLIEEDEEFEQSASLWKAAYLDFFQLKELVKVAEEREKAARQQLIDLSDDGNCRGYGVEIRRVTRKGVIDYTLVPEIQGLDLEPYRKQDVHYFTVKLEEEHATRQTDS
jgi:putative phage-type endonuclease